jgi:hypothetical protein
MNPGLLRLRAAAHIMLNQRDPAEVARAEMMRLEPWFTICQQLRRVVLHVVDRLAERPTLAARRSRIRSASGFLVLLDRSRFGIRATNRVPCQISAPRLVGSESSRIVNFKMAAVSCVHSQKPTSSIRSPLIRWQRYTAPVMSPRCSLANSRLSISVPSEFSAISVASRAAFRRATISRCRATAASARSTRRAARLVSDIGSITTSLFWTACDLCRSPVVVLKSHYAPWAH